MSGSLRKLYTHSHAPIGRIVYYSVYGVAKSVQHFLGITFRAKRYLASEEYCT